MKKFLIASFILIFSVLSTFLLFSCGEEEKPSTVKKCDDDKHQYVAWEIEEKALCNKEGIRKRTCVICKLHTQRQKYDDKDNHNYVNDVCTYCKDKKGPDNVGFVLSDDKTYYTLASVEDPNVVEYNIPATYDGLPVKIIASNAFSKCKKLEKVIVPNSVQRIRKGAFAECYSLKEITLPFVGETKTSENAVFGYIFGENAYNGSVGIDQIIGDKEYTFWIPVNLIDVTVKDGELKDGCFENCTNIKRIHYEGSSDKVGDKAFNNCALLDTVELSETVTKLGTRSFQHCAALSYFDFENIEEIGTYCFTNSALTYVHLENTSSVQTGAFSNCLFLKNVQISSTLRTLPKYMFKDCTTLDKVELEDKVKKIGESCFSGCTVLLNVKLSSTIEEIGEMAFKDCVSLITITVPSSTKELGKGVFNGCTSLTDVKLEEGVEKLSELLFSKCTSLSEIVIPASVKEFEDDAFFGCSSLKKISFDRNNYKFTEIDGNIYNITKDELILYSPGNDVKSFTIPDSVRKIRKGAFDFAMHLEEVVFPETLDTIPSNLFVGNKTIKSVVVKNIDMIGENAFAMCSSLKSVTIDGVLSIDEGAFSNCELLKTVNISNVSYINENAFRSCTALKELNFESGSVEIENQAFSDCTSLESLVLKCVSSVGEFTFSNCTSLKEVDIHAGLSSIGEACFKDCKSLSKFKLSSTVSEVNAYAFEGCYSLEAFEVSAASTKFKVFEGHLVESNRNYVVVFAPGQIKERTVIQEGIVGVGKFAFRNATHMKKVEIPSSLKFIGQEAFYNTGLERVDLNSVEEIGKYAFGRSLSLEKITIPKSVIKIEDYAFQDCINLKKIEIYNTMTTMGYAIFHITEELKELMPDLTVVTLEAYVEFLELPETWSQGWLSGRSGILDIYGPF